MARPTTKLRITIANKLPKSCAYVKLEASRLQYAFTEDSSKIDHAKSEHSNYKNKQRENRNSKNNKQHNKDSLLNETHVDFSYKKGGGGLGMGGGTEVNGSADNKFHKESDHLKHVINKSEEKKIDQSADYEFDENYGRLDYHAKYQIKTADPGYGTILSGESFVFPVETSSDIVYIYAYLYIIIGVVRKLKN